MTLGPGLGILLEIGLTVKGTAKGAGEGVVIIFNEINHRVLLERVEVHMTVVHTIEMARQWVLAS